MLAYIARKISQSSQFILTPSFCPVSNHYQPHSKAQQYNGSLSNKP
jgi:hypothetical protein